MNRFFCFPLSKTRFFFLYCSSNKVTYGSDAEWTKALRMTCDGGDSVVLVRRSIRPSKMSIGLICND